MKDFNLIGLQPPVPESSLESLEEIEVTMMVVMMVMRILVRMMVKMILMVIIMKGKT